MHDVLRRQLGLRENKNDRDFCVETTSATSTTPGSNTEAIFIDYAVKQDYVSALLAAHVTRDH
jgi:hypothetical protein